MELAHFDNRIGILGTPFESCEYDVQISEIILEENPYLFIPLTILL